MNATKIMGIALIVLLAVFYGSRRSLGQSKLESEFGDQEQNQPRAAATEGKPPANAKIEPNVYQRLKKSSDGRVYVMVTLKPLKEEAPGDQQRKAAAEKRQDELLAKMGADEFEAGYRFQSDPIIFGHVSAKGLKKLQTDSSVRAVQYIVEEGVHARLSDSPDGRVLVAIGLRKVARHLPSIDERMARVRAIQDAVLSRVESEGLTIRSRGVILETITAWVNAEALEDLSTDADVLGVGTVPIEEARPEG